MKYYYEIPIGWKNYEQLAYLSECDNVKTDSPSTTRLTCHFRIWTKDLEF